MKNKGKQSTGDQQRKFPGHSNPPPPPQQDSDIVYNVPFTIGEMDYVMTRLIDAEASAKAYALLDGKFAPIKMKAMGVQTFQSKMNADKVIERDGKKYIVTEEGQEIDLSTLGQGLNIIADDATINIKGVTVPPDIKRLNRIGTSNEYYDRDTDYTWKKDHDTGAWSRIEKATLRDNDGSRETN